MTWGNIAVETVHVPGQGQLHRHFVLGVVVARDHEDGDVGLLEAGHLTSEEQSRVDVPPGAVVDVPG